MNIYCDESLSSLFLNAKQSPRKRAHFNLHSSFDDKVQRLFIALVKGSYVKPHYHELSHQWEMFVVISGTVRICIFDITGQLEKEILVGDGQQSKVIELFPNEVHSVECISETALMLEVKEGPFNPKFAKVESAKVLP